jgi:ubiquinone/menaquinone biosynthesis C-methylase UbiE
VTSRFTAWLGRRYARLTTNAVVRRPNLWRLFRRPMRLQFDRLAPVWDSMRMPDSLASFERALEQLEGSPERALDLGTGTGIGAFAIARRFPETQVVGADLAPEMLAEARRLTPPDLAGRIRFEQADAARLPYEDGAFNLIGLSNMIPFFDELDRVLAPGGYLILSFSGGPETPIWVPPERVRAQLSRREFLDFSEFWVARGMSVLAHKPPAG